MIEQEVVDRVMQLLEIISMVIALAAAISAMTPTKLDDEYTNKAKVLYNRVSTIVNVLGLNIGKARNADAPAKKE